MDFSDLGGVSISSDTTKTVGRFDFSDLGGVKLSTEQPTQTRQPGEPPNIKGAALGALKATGQFLKRSTPIGMLYNHPEALPGIGGAALGIASGGLGLLPAVGMAALGGAGGEGYSQILNRLKGGPAPETPLEATKSMAIQGAKQAAYEVGGRAIGAGLGAMGERAGKTALGFSKRFLNSPQKFKRATEALETLGKEGAIGPIDSVKTIQSNVQKIEDASGAAIGKFLKEQGVGFDTPAVIQKLESLRPVSENGVILRGGQYDADNTLIDKAIETIKAHGADKIHFNDANKIKGLFQRVAKHAFDSGDPAGLTAKAIAGTMRTAVDDGLEEASKLIPTGAQDFAEFIRNKKLFSAASAASKPLADRVALMGNKMFGLTDTITGASIGGASFVKHGGPASALVGVGAVLVKKVGEKYGPQIAYNVAQAVSKNPSLIPTLGRVVGMKAEDFVGNLNGQEQGQ